MVRVAGGSVGRGLPPAAGLGSLSGSGAAAARCVQAARTSPGGFEIRRVWGRVVPMTSKGAAC